MPNKFEEQKEKQGLLLYTAVFLMIITTLYLVRGVSFDFSVPEIVIEEGEDYSGAKELLKVIQAIYDFDKSEPFSYIVPFDGDLGRSNPFIIEERLEVEEDQEEDL